MKSFWDGFKKEAAARSEMIGTVLSAPAAPLAALVGLVAGPYSDKQLEKVNKRGPTNLIPGVGAYRLTRRSQTLGVPDKDRS